MADSNNDLGIVDSHSSITSTLPLPACPILSLTFLLPALSRILSIPESDHSKDYKAGLSPYEDADHLEAVRSKHVGIGIAAPGGIKHCGSTC